MNIFFFTDMNAQGNILNVGQPVSQVITVKSFVYLYVLKNDIKMTSRFFRQVLSFLEKL